MKLAVSSATLFNMTTGQFDQDAINQTAILLDDGRIFAHVEPAAYDRRQMTHAGPNTLKPTDIAVVLAGVYALATNGFIYRYEIGAIPEQGRWAKTPDAKDVVAMSSDAEGRIWCVNKKGELYVAVYNRMQLDPRNWAKVDAVDIAGVMATSPKQTIKQLSVNSSRPLDLSTGRYFGPFNNAVAVLTSRNQVYFDHNADMAGGPAPMFRAQGEPANLVDIAISQAGVYAFDTAGHVYGYNSFDGNGRWLKDRDAKDVIGIAGDSDAGIRVLNRKGEIYRAQRELGGGIGSWSRVTEVDTARFWGPTWTYTVQPKDGLYQIIREQYGISDQRGLQSLSDEIVRLNRLSNANQISAGQVLTMPAVA